MASGRRLMFFATRDDLLRALKRVEEQVPLTYRLCVSDTADVPAWGAAATIPDLGPIREGRWNDQPSYLVMPAASPFTLHECKSADGRTARGVYPVGNSDSVVLYPGGPFADTFLFCGEFAVGLPKPPGLDLVGAFRRALRAEFEWIANNFVGPGARELAESGLRLVGSTWQPAKLDLKLPKRRAK